MSEKDRKILGLDFDPKPLGTYEHGELAFCLTVLQQYRFGALRALPKSENEILCAHHLFEEVLLILSDINDYLIEEGRWMPQDEAIIDVKWVHFYLSNEFDTICYVVPVEQGKDMILMGMPPLSHRPEPSP
jgi:hypothetical protein